MTNSTKAKAVFSGVAASALVVGVGVVLALSLGSGDEAMKVEPATASGQEVDAPFGTVDSIPASIAEVDPSTEQPEGRGVPSSSQGSHSEAPQGNSAPPKNPAPPTVPPTTPPTAPPATTPPVPPTTVPPGGGTRPPLGGQVGNFGDYAVDEPYQPPSTTVPPTPSDPVLPPVCTVKPYLQACVLGG